MASVIQAHQLTGLGWSSCTTLPGLDTTISGLTSIWKITPITSNTTAASCSQTRAAGMPSPSNCLSGTVLSETALGTSSGPVSALTTSTTTTPLSTVPSAMALDGGSKATTAPRATLSGPSSRHTMAGGRVWRGRRSGLTSLEIVSLSNLLLILLLLTDASAKVECANMQTFLSL